MARGVHATAWFLSASLRLGRFEQLLIASSLLGLCGDISMSLPWHGVQMTEPIRQDAYQTNSNAPPPTAAPVPPNVVVRRQNLDSNTCGFIDGNIGNPLTCSDPLQTCVTDKGLRAFGCCTTATTGHSLGSFVECGFHTACVDSHDTSGNTTRVANALVQTCSSSGLFCQKSVLSYLDTISGDGIFIDFRCGYFPLTRILHFSTLTSASSSATAPATSTASSFTPVIKESTPIIAPSPISTASSKSAIAAIAGSIGGVVAVLLIVYCWAFLNGCNGFPRIAAVHPRVRHAADRKLKKPSKPKYNKDPTKSGSISESQLRTWRVFLSMYGEEGIVLRELMMLVSALYFPVADVGRHQHWLPSGERGSASPPSSNDFFLAVLKDASSENDLIALEKELEAHRILVTREKDYLCVDQNWITDCRAWCALSSNTDSSVDYTPIWRDLLAIYSQMPHKDVHPIAERYRELFYNHAHVAIMKILPVAQEVELDIATETLFCNVGLQVLSHRYQVEDFKLLSYLQRRVKRTLPDILQLRGGQYQNLIKDTGASVTLRLAELRMVMEQYERSKGRSYAVQPSLHDTEAFLSKPVHTRTALYQRGWGMIGYVLVELMSATEVLQERDTFERITRVTEIWRDKAMASGSSIEMAALCCVLVRLRAFDELYRLPEEHYLSSGYYLARAGYLTVAEIFLSMGIQYYERALPRVPMWRYHLELCGVKMRLGKWEETLRWLSSKWMSFDSVKNDIPGGTFEKNKSGEYGEYRLNLAFLLTDCYIATNRVSDALRTISDALRPVASMRDSFVRSICVALRARKMSLHLHIEDMYGASMTAVDLCRDLQDPATLAAEIQSSFWTVQEILACVDKLVHAEHQREAYFVLNKLTGWTKGEASDQRNQYFNQDFESSLPDDLKEYAYQRWREISSMIELRGSNNAWDSTNLVSPSSDIVSTSTDPALTSVETNQVPFTALDQHGQVLAVSSKSSKPKHDVEKVTPSLHDATDIPQGSPMQSGGPSTTGQTAQSTLPAVGLPSEKPRRSDKTRIRQGVTAEGSDALHHRRSRKNLMMLAKLRKPPRTDPSRPIIQQHWSEKRRESPQMAS